jgi:hypothetical protein
MLCLDFQKSILIGQGAAQLTLVAVLVRQDYPFGLFHTHETRGMGRSSLALIVMPYTSNWRSWSAARAKILVELTEMTGLEKQHIKSLRCPLGP